MLDEVFNRDYQIFAEFDGSKNCTVFPKIRGAKGNRIGFSFPKKNGEKR